MFKCKFDQAAVATIGRKEAPLLDDFVKSRIKQLAETGMSAEDIKTAMMLVCLEQATQIVAGMIEDQIGH